MKSAAYLHAAGGPLSPEIRLSQAIDRYGVAAVLGRPVLYMKEHYALKIAESIVNGYRSRERAENIAAWQNEHPDMGNLLAELDRDLNG